MRLAEFNQRAPIGGHRFKEKDGTLLQGRTKEDVLAAIKNHRLVNGLPSGDPEHELCVYYAEIAPQWVEPGGAESVKSDETLALDWINKLWGTRHPFLLRQDALVRAGVCESCPMRKDFSGSLESVELRRRGVMLTEGVMPAIGLCAHHKWHCGVACLLTEPVGRPDAPDSCWLADTKPA